MSLKIFKVDKKKVLEKALSDGGITPMIFDRFIMVTEIPLDKIFIDKSIS